MNSRACQTITNTQMKWIQISNGDCWCWWPCHLIRDSYPMLYKFRLRTETILKAYVCILYTFNVKNDIVQSQNDAGLLLKQTNARIHWNHNVNWDTFRLFYFSTENACSEIRSKLSEKDLCFNGSHFWLVLLHPEVSLKNSSIL